MATVMTGPKPWFSHYDEIKVPEGYHLRHYETHNTRSSYRAVIIGCNKTKEKVAELEEYFDAAAGKARYGATIRDVNEQVVQRFDEYSLQKLFTVICARHRIGVK